MSTLPKHKIGNNKTQKQIIKSQNQIASGIPSEALMGGKTFHSRLKCFSNQIAVEFQKHGLPHIHITLSLNKDYQMKCDKNEKYE